jgi:DNA replication protein DnaC
MRRLSEILPQANDTSLASTAGSSSNASAADGECPRCHGARFLRRAVPPGHTDFGLPVACACARAEPADRRLQRLLAYSNIGALRRLTFENLLARGRSANARDQEQYRRCVEDARAFAAKPEGWLVLSGRSGCGKTHIAAAVVNDLLARGSTGLFVVVPDLLDHLRGAYQPGAEIGYDELFERVRNAPLLVLDDLGTQAPTPWAQEKLFQLVNHRFNAQLPTLVTTNLSPDEFDERLRTRLTDPATARIYVLESQRPSRVQSLDVLDHPVLREMRFERFDVRALHLPLEERKRVENAYRQSLAFAESPTAWLLLLGPHGSGKTHLAAAIANYRRAAGESPAFVKVPALLDELRRNFSSDGDGAHRMLDELRAAPLLVLDDLDAQTAIGWVRDRLFQILDHRHTARLPTVITSALTMEELGDRLASRLMDPAACTVIVLGPPARPEVPAASRRARRPKS